jgi:hypothetical protein
MIKLSRRAVSAAAAVLTVGAGSLTWAASSASAGTGFIPRCAQAQLAVWVNADGADGTAGTTYYHLEFTNIGRTTCHLNGFPGVSATNLAGHQLGVPAVRSSAVPAQFVNIPPGGTAHSILGYVDIQVGPPCKPVTASYLKVFPPGDTSARHAFFALPVCTDKTPVLTIRRVQPGV